MSARAAIADSSTPGTNAKNAKKQFILELAFGRLLVYI